MTILNNHEIDEITNQILSLYNLDFRHYAKSSLSRRLARMMALNGLLTKTDLENYINNINDINSFIGEITVNTTEMFRDPIFWSTLKSKIFPILNNNDNLHIWHAGCSTGEEVVTMQILLRELEYKKKVTVYATDIDRSVMAKAQTATFSKKNLDTCEQNYIQAGGEFSIQKYIEKSDYNSFTLDKSLLENVTFKKFDLVKDENYAKFDLILCRNVLIYFDFKLQEIVIQKFTNSLFKYGFLAIGLKESIISETNLKDIYLYDDSAKVFRCKN